MRPVRRTFATHPLPRHPQPRNRQRIHALFLEANQAAATTYQGEDKALYQSLKLEGILEAPQNLLILCDQNPAQGKSLGRQTMPETALFSTVCAIQNLWLAARAEGVAVGWVSILDPQALRETLAIPARLTPVAYLCLGYVEAFATSPELERHGWESRVPLASVLYEETFPGNPSPSSNCSLFTVSCSLLADNPPTQTPDRHKIP